MKIVLTGSTGFIGHEVLNRCLANSQIKHIIVLSRRKIPELDGNSKAKVVLMEDFTQYSPEVLRDLDGSDASIWCLGSYDDSELRDIGYPIALFDALASTPSFKSRAQPFHHVHLSGAVVETDQKKSLWFMSEARKAKGRAQTKVMEFGNDANLNGIWKTYLVRPGYVIPSFAEGSWFHYIVSLILGPHYSVRNDELAVTMVDMAINGGSRPILSSKEIGERGQQLLAQKAS